MRLLLIPVVAAIAACVPDPEPEEPLGSAGRAGAAGKAGAATAGAGGQADGGAAGQGGGAGSGGKSEPAGKAGAGGKAGTSGAPVGGSGGGSGQAAGGSAAGSPAALPDYCKAPTPAAPGKGCAANAGGITYCGPQCGTFPAYHACFGEGDAPTAQAGQCQRMSDSDVPGITVFCCERYSCYDYGSDCPDGLGRLWSCATPATPPISGCSAYGASGTVYCCK